eukprot:TRINITY_DN20111_c0_g1_i9.p1 TRINITY_DN20111_c0_g1~~TRINITY_DN20111_c0_g1_i9.p1  ORF type:complete len:443 (-),score=84.16 TRINITY_DN20111_c0_g1_i9:252-1580(-)
MLPRKLCDNLCSLHGGKDRPCFSVVIQLCERTGTVLAPPRFTLGRMRSAGKLTYELAQRIIDSPDSATVQDHVASFLETSTAVATCLCGAVDRLHHVAVKMRASRMCLAGRQEERGLEQPRYFVDQGTVHKCEDEKQSAEAHHLIEEFMLLTNRLVAEKLIQVYPEHAIVRAQPPPEERRIKQFLRDCEVYGVTGEDEASIAAALAARTRSEDPEEAMRALVLQLQLIRCSSPAEYVCTGTLTSWKHTSLGFESYTHFTSPIRRYADLLVHRLLIDAALLESPVPSIGDTAVIAEHCRSINSRAKRAKWAQRDAEFVCMCQFLLQNPNLDPEPAVVLGLGEKYISLLVPSLGEEVQVLVADCSSEHTWDPTARKLSLELKGDSDEGLVLGPLDLVLVRVSATLSTYPPQLTAIMVPPSMWPHSGLKFARKLSDELLDLIDSN